MLEDDADAELAGKARVRDPHGFPLPDDLARVRPQDAVDDVDERALAGAVLAEEGMDLARLYGKPDIVVCKAAGESLDDSAISTGFCRASPTTPGTPDSLPRSRTG